MKSGERAQTLILPGGALLCDDLIEFNEKVQALYAKIDTLLEEAENGGDRDETLEFRINVAVGFVEEAGERRRDHADEFESTCRRFPRERGDPAPASARAAAG